MKKFEYKQINPREVAGSISAFMSKEGADGWQLVSVTEHYFYWKRELSEEVQLSLGIEARVIREIITLEEALSRENRKEEMEQIKTALYFLKKVMRLPNDTSNKYDQIESKKIDYKSIENHFGDTEWLQSGRDSK